MAIQDSYVVPVDRVMAAPGMLCQCRVCSCESQYTRLAHSSPSSSLAFTHDHTPHSTHVPPPPTLLTFSTVFCLCLVSWWPSLGRAVLPCEKGRLYHTTAHELALLHLVHGVEGRISGNTLVTRLVVSH